MSADYTVVGAGAIGGTIGARLARDGHAVLFCDADAEHVAAINERGLALEGPVEQFTVEAPAVLPDELPDRLGAVLLAVKHSTPRPRSRRSRRGSRRTASSSRSRTGSTSR